MYNHKSLEDFVGFLFHIKVWENPTVNLEEQKKEIKKKILLAVEPFSYEVKLLITVRGIIPLSALAFLADVADIERLKR